MWGVVSNSRKINKRRHPHPVSLLFCPILRLMRSSITWTLRQHRTAQTFAPPCVRLNRWNFDVRRLCIPEFTKSTTCWFLSEGVAERFCRRPDRQPGTSSLPIFCSSGYIIQSEAIGGQYPKSHCCLQAWAYKCGNFDISGQVRIYGGLYVWWLTKSTDMCPVVLRLWEARRCHWDRGIYSGTSANARRYTYSSKYKHNLQFVNTQYFSLLPHKSCPLDTLNFDRALSTRLPWWNAVLTTSSWPKSFTTE